MCVWIQPKHIPALAFVVPPHEGDIELLISFHLSLLMGYLESAPAFCCATEMVADLANTMWGEWQDLPTHPLEAIAACLPPENDEVASGILKKDCEDLLDHHLIVLLENKWKSLWHYIDVYINDFICLCQGGHLHR